MLSCIHKKYYTVSNVNTVIISILNSTSYGERCFTNSGLLLLSMLLNASTKQYVKAHVTNVCGNLQILHLFIHIKIFSSDGKLYPKWFYHKFTVHYGKCSSSFLIHGSCDRWVFFTLTQTALNDRTNVSYLR